MHKVRKVRYEPDSANTETLIAVDETIEHKFGNLQRAYNEGFAASSGVRGATAETNRRIPAPEKRDDSHPRAVPESIENENSGLADN